MKFIGKYLELLENALIKYGIAALIITIPLYPKFPFLKIPGSFVSIRLEDFLIALVILIWGLTQIKQRFSFLKDNLVKIFILYFVIGFLSLISAIVVTDSVTPYIGLLHTLRRIEYMAAFFVVVSYIKTSKQLIFYFQVILLTAFAIFLYGIGQKFFLFPVISTMNSEFAKGIALRLHPGARVSSTFAGHYDLAAYLVLILPVIVAYLLAVKSKIQKILVFIVLLSSFWLLLVSASRISFVAYLFSITFTLWFIKKKIFIIPVLGLSIVASMFTPQLMNRYSQTAQVALYQIKKINFNLPWAKNPLTISFSPDAIPSSSLPSVGEGETVKKIRILPTPTNVVPTPGERKVVFYGAGEEIPQTEDRSTSIRIKVEWPRALRALAKNPLLGTGFSSITLATDNDYLRSLGEVGILGTLAFGLILISILIRTKKYLFQKKQLIFEEMLIIGLTGACLGFLANALFIDVFEASKVAITFWLLMGILVAAVNILKNKNETI